MVSMVDPGGRLVPEQRGQRAVQLVAVIIRTGLYVDRIMPMLASYFPIWDYRHRTYY